MHRGDVGLMPHPKYGKPIPGFDGYTVTRAGSVFSHFHGPRRLHPTPHHHGHLRVQFRRDGRPKSLFVHVAVALTFIGPQPFPDARVLHGDGNPRNNRVANLRWGTQLENVRDMERHGTVPRGERAGSSVLSRRAVRRIREHREAGTQVTVLAKRYGVNRSTIANAVSGRTWGHVE